MKRASDSQFASSDDSSSGMSRDACAGCCDQCRARTATKNGVPHDVGARMARKPA
jgi:hypothetical protein